MRLILAVVLLSGCGSLPRNNCYAVGATWKSERQTKTVAMKFDTFMEARRELEKFWVTDLAEAYLTPNHPCGRR